MSKENEANRDWRIEPCANPPGWFTVGYTYEGIRGRQQGEFVPVHHWASQETAELYRDALLCGHSRNNAILIAKG